MGLECNHGVEEVKTVFIKTLGVLGEGNSLPFWEGGLKVR
jgi:hypothetical protein